MKIEVSLTSAPIARPAWEMRPDDECGALAEFYGIVRGSEDEKAIAGLVYEAYATMAISEMTRLMEALAYEHGLRAARVIHRSGPIQVGETAIYIGIRAAHRAEAFEGLRKFMDRLKKDVPIWKSEVLQILPDAVVHHESVDEVLSLLNGTCQVLPASPTPLNEAVGQVLAEPVFADADQPPFDRSAVDGYVVVEGSEAGQFLVLGEILPGTAAPMEVPSDSAWRIFTGAEVPEGCGVVMLEDASLEADDRVTLRAAASTRFVRRRASSLKKDAEILQAGELLGAGEIALLASVGISRPAVIPKPRILHVTTGREIIRPDQQPGVGQIRDANGPLIHALGCQAGVFMLPQRHVDESLEALVDAVNGSQAFDILLISGGSSVGAHDRTPQALEALGFQILSRRVRARPGKPLLIAKRGSQLAFGLPGNPVSHFAVFHVFVARAIALLAGRRPIDFVPVRLGSGAPLCLDARETFWPAHVRIAEGVPTAIPLPWLDSGDLAALRGVDALLRIPANTEPPAPGCLIDALFCGDDRSFTCKE